MQFDDELIRELRAKIKLTLLENCGGCKESVLITELTAYCFQNHLDINFDFFVPTFFHVFDLMKLDNELGILTYSYPLSEQCVREKRFFYIP